MKVLKRIILYTLLALGALIMVFPFFWMLLSSVKTAAEVNTMPPTFWPAEPVFENYTFAFSKAPNGFLNNSNPEIMKKHILAGQGWYASSNRRTTVPSQKKK